MQKPTVTFPPNTLRAIDEMQALAHNLTPVGSLASSRQGSRNVGTSRGAFSLRLACNYRKCGRLMVKAAAVGGEEEETRQAKEMAAAKRRWDALIREQKIKVLTPREAGYATQLSNKVLLDVRPTVERNKASVKGSVWIPIFDLDDATDLGTVSKKITNFVMGGWWSGSPTLVYNRNFMSKIVEKFPKDADIIVVCQKGLRSLAACEQLYNAGFQNLFWVQGGLEAAEEEDFQREGPQPFKLAGVGGVSEFFGWTDQQRAWAAKEGLGYRLQFTGRLIGLIVLVDALYLGAQKLGPLLQEMQAH